MIFMEWQDMLKIAKNTGLEVTNVEGNGAIMHATTCAPQPQLDYFKRLEVRVDFKRGDVEDFLKEVKSRYNLPGADELVKTALQTDESAWDLPLEDLLKEAKIAIDSYDWVVDHFVPAMEKALKKEKLPLQR